MKRYNLLRQVLKDNKIQNQDIAERLGITPQAVSSKMVGKSAWTLEQAYTVVCDMLGLSPIMLSILFPAADAKVIKRSA